VHSSLFTTFGTSGTWWLCLLLIVSSVLIFEFAVSSLRAAFFTTPEDVFQALEKDPSVKRRFEEAASEELQAGWDRESKLEREAREEKQSMKLLQETADDVVRNFNWCGGADMSGIYEGRRVRDKNGVFLGILGEDLIFVDGDLRRRSAGGEEMMAREDADKILSQGFGAVKKEGGSE
jgi:hypothetical protein